MDDRVLLRAGELPGRVIVSVPGEDIAQIRDVVYDTSSGEVIGFTLAKRGMFGGKMKQRLPWENVVGLGPSALIVDGDEAFIGKDGLRQPADDRDVIGARVLTDDGRQLGEVRDLVIEVHQGKADVIGYEIEPAESFRDSSNHVLLPLPDTLAASGDNLVVPSAATNYVRDDIAGFGAAVDDFRASLKDDA
jgi:uncharacterized protein YrrD